MRIPDDHGECVMPQEEYHAVWSTMPETAAKYKDALSKDADCLRKAVGLIGTPRPPHRADRHALTPAAPFAQNLDHVVCMTVGSCRS